jgi:hypothetical protein
MTWELYRCLENSLKDFLDAQITTDSIKDINGTVVPVRVGRENDDNWTLPCISEYVESEASSKFEVGSNLTDDRFLIIIDIYATNSGERLDLARWLKEELKDGFRYYSYVINESSPENPTKTAGGWVNVNFLTNTRVKLGQNVSEIDAHRHQITINCWIS